MEAPWTHATVLLNEAVDALFGNDSDPDSAQADGTYVDATFGRGGHSRLILSHLSPVGRLIAEGTPSDISSNDAVIDAYLGSHHDLDLRPDILTNPSEGSVEAEPDAGTLEAP